MTMTPGGGPSLGVPPPRISPEQRNGTGQSPRQPHPSAANRVLHWGLIFGGLVTIVDLAATLYTQQTAGACGTPSSLVENGDLVVNAVLLVLAGLFTYRESGSIRQAILAGLIASTLDGIVVAVTGVALNCPVDAATGMTANDVLLANLLFNITQGPIVAGLAAFVTMVLRRQPPTPPTR